MDSQSSKTSLTLDSSLQGFFFDELLSINKKSAKPLPKEAIYYSSLVLDQFVDSKRLFDISEGRPKQKILGIKLMESASMGKIEQERTIKDVAETALITCGYFSDSLNRKIIDTDYYQKIGKSAYQKLNSLKPEAYNQKYFFKHISDLFETIIMLINIVAQKIFSRNNGEDNNFLLWVAS